MLLLSFVGECLRSANQPIHAGLYKAYVCIFLVLKEIEMLLFMIMMNRFEVQSSKLPLYMYMYKFMHELCVEC